MNLESSPRPLLPALFGLRGLAALAVLLFHLHHLTGLPLPPRLGFIGSHFGLGVQFFFVLSGFTLALVAAEAVGRPDWVRRYAGRRFFRVAPLFFLLLAAWLVVSWSRGIRPDPATIVLNLSLLFGLVPGKHESLVAAGWPIGVVTLFFAVVPLVAATIRDLRGAVVVLAVAAAVSGAGRAALAQGGGVLAAYANVSFVAALVVFAAGIAAYHVWRRLPTGRAQARLVALAALGVLLMLLSPLGNRLLGPWRPDIMLWSLCFAGIVVWQAAEPARLLSAGLLRFIGERFYGVYLLHPLVIILGDGPIRRLHAALLPSLGDWSFLVVGGVVAAAVVAAAAASYAFVERPAMQLGRWWIDRPAAAQPPTRGDVGPGVAAALAGGTALVTGPAAAGGGLAWPAPVQRLLSGAAWSRAPAAFAAVMFCFSAWVTFRAVDQPLIDIHAFRQTQTALTAEWMVREGWRLDYQTPVAGAPWAIPLEFPIYQSLVAAVVAVTGLDLSATGRVVSWLFLVACAWPACGLADRLRLPRSVAWTFCTLLWSAPLYVYWGRTFMIETAAMFFSLACLPWWLDVVRGEGGRRSRWLFVLFASLAVLQKATTGGPLLLVLLVAAAVRWLLPGDRPPGTRPAAAWALALSLASLAVGAAWTAHANAVNLANPLGRILSGKSMNSFLFGTFAQKLDLETWRMVVWERGFRWNAAGLLGVAALACFWAWPAPGRTPEHRRDRLLVLGSLTLYLLPILIFTNLHWIHEYYQVACVVFLLAALAVVLGSWLPRLTGLAAVTTLALVPFVLANLKQYRAAYGIVVARPLEQQDPGAVSRYRLGEWLRQATPPESGLVVFGQTWNSELPFHSGRKACVCPTWHPEIDRAWEHPEEMLGGLPLGAIVVTPEPTGNPAKGPTKELVAARIAAGGWRHDVVQGSDVLRPDPAVKPSAPPTDPGAPTTSPR